MLISPHSWITIVDVREMVCLAEVFCVWLQKIDLRGNIRMKAFTAIVVVIWFFAVAVMPGSAEAGPALLTPEDHDLTAVQTFIQQHCADCHSDGASEGGFTIEELVVDLDDEATFRRWERVFDLVSAGEMPPAEADQPTMEERAELVLGLRPALHDAHRSRAGTVLRRLNRREYQNTLNDLFGTNLDLESMLPADGRFHEFDNVGSSLNVSMVQLQTYLDAIDLVLDTAIAKTVEATKPTIISTSYKETREAKIHLGKAWKLLDDGAVVFYRTIGYPTGMLRTAVASEAGYYRIKVTGYAHQSQKPITFSIGATTFARGVEKPIFSYHNMPPGEPTSVEIVAWMDRRYMLAVEPWNLFDTGYLIKKDGIDSYPGLGLAVLNVEMEGPLVDQFPSNGHRLLFDGIERSEIQPSNPTTKLKSWYVPKFEVAIDDQASEIRSALARIAATAFRKPVFPNEVDRYVQLFHAEVTAGSETEAAYRTAVAAIFCSPDFLFLQESEGPLSDHQLASRLSYFLNRTLPDQPLRLAAKTRRLGQNPKQLQQQVQRLLTDPHFDRFVEDFADAWLNLRDIDFTSPDQSLFPEYDQFLQHSMIEETQQYLHHLITQNRPAAEIVSSKYTMLNNRLALHYDLPMVTHPDVRKVELPEGSVRGGFLSMASVLKVSANGTNTSPVVRGVWVLERILGETPQPPPPGIPGVEPDIRGASTLRELLDKHRDIESCRSCHQLIDPPGFALESFDPIGGWRDRFRSLGAGDKVAELVQGRKVRYRIGPPVDSSGHFADGKTFTGFAQFRQILAADEDRIARTILTKLLVFASGREMGFSDRDQIDALLVKSKRNQHRLGDMIQLVVGSDIFRSK